MVTEKSSTCSSSGASVEPEFTLLFAAFSLRMNTIMIIAVITARLNRIMNSTMQKIIGTNISGVVFEA